MPVLPLVGSTITVSLLIFPARSAASIIARPMRSLTLESGLKNSHLASTVACPGGISRLIRTSGVPPIVSVMSLKTRPWGFRGMVGSPSGNGQNPTRAQAHDPICVDRGPNAVKIRDLDEKHASFNDDPIRARHIE